MHLATQDSFGGGLNTRVESSRISPDSYPLLFNGRVVKNTVKPVKKHKKLDSPAGTKQSLYALGEILILFVNGNAWWRNVVSNTDWTLIAGWTPLNATGRIYAEAIPASYYLGNISYDETDPDIGNVKRTFPGLAAPTSGQLFVTDGISQPRVINPDGTWAITNTYAKWSLTDFSYVPLCVLPKVSQGKLYAVDPTTRSKIYHSVSGRFTDFVIIRNPDGSKGGDADKSFKSVDYNKITALATLDNGGLYVGTLYASYAVMPDYTETFFGEPLLPEDRIFPTGPVNEKSFADINGDIAFISQTGIQSFNVTKQTQTESNNFPLGAPIASLFEGIIQSNTAATNFDIYALFSVNTIYGNVVLVFDTTSRQFVSIDTGFGEVVDFAVAKAAGVQKLFFINSVGELYEAYADTTTSVCRVYLGDFATTDPDEGKQVAGKQHKVNLVNLQFGNASQPTDVQVSLYADRKLLDTRTRNVPAQIVQEVAPLHVPFFSAKNCEMLGVKFSQSRFAWKSGLFVEWQGDAELFSASMLGEIATMDNVQPTLALPEMNRTISMFSDTEFLPEIADTVADTDVDGLIVGEYYSVVGTCHVGDKIFTNDFFKAKHEHCVVNGNLRACGKLVEVYNKMALADLMIGCGNHGMPSGTLTDVKHARNLFKFKELYWAAGAHDLATNSGKAFWNARKQLRYFTHNYYDIVEFFILNSGFDINGVLREPDGNTADSAQARWLQTKLQESAAKFKIICLNHAPYTDDTLAAPGFTTLRWPFASWGASMVVSGGARAYQRFAIDAIPYVTLPAPTANLGSFTSGAANSVVRQLTTGYLKLSVDLFNIRAELVSIDTEDTLDAFGLYA